MTTKTLLVAFASAITLGAISQAHATDVLPAGYETRSMTVRVDDVNLQTGAGVDKMMARIAYAAGYVCGDANGIVDLARRSQRTACIRATEDRAVADLNNEHVTELHVRAARMSLAAR